MKASYLLYGFLAVMWTVIVFLEGVSSTAIDADGKARINPAIRQVIGAIHSNAEYKFRQAVTLTDNPIAMLTPEERFVLSERFDYDEASFKSIQSYYRKLSKLRGGDLPPLFDKTVTVSPLRR